MNDHDPDSHERVPNPPTPPPPTATFGAAPGDRLTIAITGYQYPDIPFHNGSDENWLMVRGVVACASDLWTFEDPCLLTTELQDLIAWLRELPDPARPSIGFTEPLLKFRTDGTRPAANAPDASFSLQTILRAEALPPHIRAGNDTAPSIMLNLTVTPAQITAAADALAACLTRFPPRPRAGRTMQEWRELRSRMPIRGVHHIAIICSDYPASKRFYTEILGLRIVHEVYRETRRSYKLDLALPDGVQVELFSFPDPPPRPTRPESRGLRHLALRVDDLDGELTRLGAHGIVAEPVRVDEFTASRFTFIQDPDGLPIELYEDA